MSVLISIATLVGFIASVCTIVLFAEDRIEKLHRRRKRKSKMVRK